MCVCVCKCALLSHLYYTHELIYNEIEGLVVSKGEQDPCKAGNRVDRNDILTWTRTVGVMAVGRTHQAHTDYSLSA